MIKVKLTFPYSAPMQKKDWAIFRQTPGHTGVWGDIKFYLNDESDTYFDYWVVYGKLKREEEMTNCRRENTILITAEPSSNVIYNQKFIEQFGQVVTCQKELKHPNKIVYQQAQPWFIDKDYDFLKSLTPPDKPKVLSVVLSNKCRTKPQYDRLKFTLKLKEHFKDRLDWYGRGIKNFVDKWETIAPYQYSIVLENSVYKHYVTEKINDCFLTYTFPIYYGCSNLEDFYPAGAFRSIDVYDLPKSIRTIEALLENADEHYAKSIPFLHQSREKYLEQHQLFPLIQKLIEDSVPQKPAGEEQTRIKYYAESSFNKLKRKVFLNTNPISRKVLLASIPKN